MRHRWVKWKCRRCGLMRERQGSAWRYYRTGGLAIRKLSPGPCPESPPAVAV